MAKYGVTKFYTAPTAIRALMKFGEDFTKKYDLSSLKVLGTVGEPINPEAWMWYHKYVGSSQCSISDTYWQVNKCPLVHCLSRSIARNKNNCRDLS